MKSIKQILLYSLIVFVLFLILYKWPKTNTPKLIGGDKDKGGCLIGAGYSWCEEKQKCLRNWEEPCQVNSTEQFDMQGNLTKEGSDWFLLYERPGQPALRARLTFVNPEEQNLVVGDRVHIQGDIIPSPESKWIEVNVLNITKSGE
jgi:hypothetical protein